MVHDDSISFAAPSQLRLHLIVDGEGVVRVAVLNAYNQPIGALRSLATTVAEINAFLDGKSDKVVAENESATCTFLMGTDIDHRNLQVLCEEPAKWFKMEDFVIIEEFRELVDAAAAKAGSGPTLI